jgi:glutaminyl-tRNA synthetase
LAQDAPVGTDFIRDMIGRDQKSGKFSGRVVTRFPPEPNGYLHIGHAKSICLNFGVAQEFGGVCHLRFDDTNPVTEEVEFVESIQADVRWLGFDWGAHLYFASDYFARLYDYALELVRGGHAFVCDLTSEEIAARRGTLTEPGIPSPYRDRPVPENLDLFQRMQAGDFPPGARVLRAKIDMASSVLPMRDPILYRISAAVPHHRTGRTWNAYPMYDFAHCLSDAIEGITHSLCTLEFADHRPLYEWVLDTLGIKRPRPEQTEFARGNLSHTVVSKRVLRRLVEEDHVRGWDDPRMPTLAGVRRKGYPPAAIRAFWKDAGVAKRENLLELARLEAAVRDELNRSAPRAMAVLNPLRVVIVNYPEGQEETLEAQNNPERPESGTRKVPFSRELWIERDDFAETPPPKFHRLAPGREVRLRFAYFIRCEEVVKDARGEVVLVRCTYDPATRGGDAPDGRKVKGTIHWVSAQHAVSAEARLYGTLFTDPDPLAHEGRDFTEFLNPASLEIVPEVWVEPSLAGAPPGTQYQFERIGYFCVDPDSSPDRLVVNRTVTLRDSWAKMVKRGEAGAG